MSKTLSSFALDTGKQVQIQSCWLSRQLDDRAGDTEGNIMLIEDGYVKGVILFLYISK